MESAPPRSPTSAGAGCSDPFALSYSFLAFNSKGWEGIGDLGRREAVFGESSPMGGSGSGTAGERAACLRVCSASMGVLPICLSLLFKNGSLPLRQKAALDRNFST